MGVSDQAVPRRGQRVLEVGPEEQARVREEGVRDPLRWHLREAAEDQGEDDHREEGLEHRPGRPHDGLLIPDLDLPEGEEVQEFVVLLQLLPVQVEEAVLRADHQFEIVCHGLFPIQWM